jgi:hypothetical protein
MDRTAMIGARIRVDGAEGSFTILVYAESLRKAERTARTHYPDSTVSIAFPLEPECFFGGGPRAGGNADLDASKELFSITTPT